MKKISVVSPAYNESGNVQPLVERVREVFRRMPEYDYEHIIIDNASTDTTVDELRVLAADDPHVKVIVNARNFGHIRSPHHAMLEAKGDAVVVLLSDLQDPPELIEQFVREWEKGWKVVVGVKTSSEESGLMYRIRTTYYRTVERLTSVQVLRHYTGFGLYDRQVMEVVRRYGDPYPYFRGMVAEVGFPIKQIAYGQKRRERGITKNNFYTLYDMAMLGITNLSKVPLRLVTFGGFVFAGISLLIGFFYLIAKLLFWNHFELGLAPTMIGLFFLGSIQLIAIGIIGEYIGSIHTIVQNRPLVTEKERINF
ncbi:glycosyltransferase family 2 protein [Terriglobus aquaticus]|uniref:Glycosyltransferase family 2 protein n=1 Tax=Terriglobus aquaticus TaxID=940139 RepID=A0ABW9KIX2_9BACT|nr:glycosyltransferase family 2 protein [Terriglobus aquaticus]